MKEFEQAYQILNEVYGGAYLKIALSGKCIVSPSVTKICYGVLENDMLLEYYISQLVQKSPKRSAKTVLKIGIFALKNMNIPAFAVLDNCVKLYKKLGKAGGAGFVNAVLRKSIDFNFELPKDTAGLLSVKYSWPIDAVHTVLNEYGERAESILKHRPPVTYVRFKHGFSGGEYLKKAGAVYNKTELENLFTADLKAGEDFSRGVYTFQSIGSVIICELIEPCQNFLDACAAPGGKSVNLAEKCGHVTACDIHEHRVGLIESYTMRMGIENVRPLLKDSSKFDEAFENAFDGVLCDVPCSGSGVTDSNPDIKLRLSLNDLSSYNQTQAAILKNCARYVKTGGILYYSTCSLFKSENSRIVERFLGETPDFCYEKPETSLKHLDMGKGIQFLPDDYPGCGFFFAKLRKII